MRTWTRGPGPPGPSATNLHGGGDRGFPGLLPRGPWRSPALRAVQGGLATFRDGPGWLPGGLGPKNGCD
eukprot:4122238-Pyramimonas_sp.AAC.1